MAVWAFSKVDGTKNRELIYHSILDGKSRFGWSQEDKHNLLLKDNWTDWHSKQRFLLDIQPGDWIVHINTPKWGQCTAVKVTGSYEFDDGLNTTHGVDFRHSFKIDKDSICEFDRKDANVSSAVNLSPRSRYHRIYQEDAFHESIRNIKSNAVELNGQSKGEYYLKSDADKYLSELTSSIHKFNKSKNLEAFLAKVFRKAEGVVDVKENGHGYGTDYGADLIVTFKNFNFETKVVVQVKSFQGDHFSLEAVNQIKTGIEQYKADAGMIISTGNKTEKLENATLELAEETGKPIELVAGEDVARFVLKYAPEMVFNV